MTSTPLPTLKFQVAFDDADGENIVFFGNYFRLMHRALEQFLPHLGISWKEWFANSDWGVPLRHVEADFLQPLKPGDEFNVQIRVKNLGQSSVTFTYEFTDQSGKKVAQLLSAHVFVSRQQFKKVDLPPTLRERLSRAL